VAAGLLDRVEVTIVPITLGAGYPLFTEPLTEGMRLLDVTPFDSGMARLSYEIPR
jgi:dihydrofolate reductase